MPINDFTISVLNLTPDQIESVDTVSNPDSVSISLKLINKHPSCPFCGGNSSSKGIIPYYFKIPDIAGRSAKVCWKRRRYFCRDCGKTFSEDNIFTPEGIHSSYSELSQIVMDLHKINLSIKDIADRNHISPSMIEMYCDSYLNVPRQYLPENLGIDELHSDMAKYGSSYICVMVDNDKRTLTEILPSRSKHELSKYFEGIPLEERKRVKHVTMDMWQPYKDVVLKYLPNAVIAVDPFHVISHLTDDFTRLRINIMNQQPHDSAAYYLLKHWYKLLMTDKDLDNEPKYNGFFHCKMNYRDLYDSLLKINPDLTKAYQLKERYRDFNKNASYEEAAEQLDALKDLFIESDLRIYDEFIGIMNTWRDEIINSFERPNEDRKQSNSLTEFINGRLRILIDISNGLSNFPRFRSRAIYALNNSVCYSITSHLSSNKQQGKKRGTYNKNRN